MTNDDARTSAATQPMDAEALAARAIELHGLNYNCAQSVACALAPLVDADMDACFRATEAFGAGMGGLTETCGAVSGAAVVIGLAASNGMADPTSKQRTYRLVRQLVADFRAQNGATLCPDLKGLVTKQPLRSCNGCIEDAVRLAVATLERSR